MEYLAVPARTEVLAQVQAFQEGQVFIFSSGLGSDMFPLGTLMP